MRLRFRLRLRLRLRVGLSLGLGIRAGVSFKATVTDRLRAGVTDAPPAFAFPHLRKLREASRVRGLLGRVRVKARVRRFSLGLGLGLTP